jgi:hypothetical protein
MMHKSAVPTCDGSLREHLRVTERVIAGRASLVKIIGPDARALLQRRHRLSISQQRFRFGNRKAAVMRSLRHQVIVRARQLIDDEAG